MVGRIVFGELVIGLFVVGDRVVCWRGVVVEGFAVVTLVVVSWAVVTERDVAGFAVVILVFRRFVVAGRGRGVVEGLSVMSWDFFAVVTERGDEGFISFALVVMTGSAGFLVVVFIWGFLVSGLSWRRFLFGTAPVPFWTDWADSELSLSAEARAAPDT